MPEPEPERDAFGNPLRPDGASAPPAPASEAPLGAEPVAAPVAPVAAVTPAPRSPGGDGRLPARAVRVLFVLLCLLGTGAVLWRADRDALRSPLVLGREMGRHALAERSFVRAPNLQRALAVVQDELRDGEEVIMLRIEPQAVVARVRDRTGRARVLDVDLAFDVRSSASGTDASSEPIRLADIDPAVPARIVREALRRAGARGDDARLSYVVLSGAANTAPTWLVSLRDVELGNQSWASDFGGLAVTRPGELPEAAGVTSPSLLAPENLRRALTAIDRLAGRAVSVRLAPERLNVMLVRRDGLASVQVDAALRVVVRESPGTATGRIDLAAIDPGGPRRAVTAAARRAGRPVGRIDYLVLAQPAAIGTADPEWVLFFAGGPQDGRAWRATLDGRVRPL